jgi:flagellar capping protein FliD
MAPRNCLPGNQGDRPAMGLAGERINRLNSTILEQRDEIEDLKARLADAEERVDEAYRAGANSVFQYGVDGM